MLVKSPVNRIGGKFYLTNWLIQKLPKHTLYCEPFCGAGHLLFSKESSPIEILNDVDDNLVNLYRCIQDGEKRSRLIAFLNETPYARSVFQSWKYGDKTTLDDIEKAGQYFFLCKASFAGDVERGGFAVPSTTGRNPAQTYQNSIDAIEHIAKRLKGITIECLGYVECIMRYDSPETLFYIDCPYCGHEHYYGDSFTQDDHCKLSGLLHGIKGKVMVSHYSNSLYDNLYKGWQRYEYQSFKGSHKAEPGTEKPKTLECLFCNFEPPKTRSLFDAME